MALLLRLEDLQPTNVHQLGRQLAKKEQLTNYIFYGVWTFVLTEWGSES